MFLQTILLSKSIYSLVLDDKKVGETVLFFGCRKCSEDYLYEEELAKYKQDNVLTGLHVAFSRDQVL